MSIPSDQHSSGPRRELSDDSPTDELPLPDLSYLSVSNTIASHPKATTDAWDEVISKSWRCLGAWYRKIGDRPWTPIPGLPSTHTMTLEFKFDTKFHVRVALEDRAVSSEEFETTVFEDVIVDLKLNYGTYMLFTAPEDTETKWPVGMHLEWREFSVCFDTDEDMREALALAHKLQARLRGD